MTRDDLRAFVDGVQRDVGKLQGTSPPAAASVAKLVQSWGRLVDYLALGPAPELRDCPRCGATGMREATRCGHCWVALVPPGPPAGRVEGAAGR